MKADIADSNLYTKDRHPGHRSRRQTSTICHICLKWFCDRNWWKMCLDKYSELRESR